MARHMLGGLVPNRDTLGTHYPSIERQPMRFTMEVPVSRSTTADSVIQTARALEQEGFTALAFTDHPAPSVKWVGSGGHPTFDPFAALSFCAAVTEDIQLMTYVAVLPYRNPLLTAKLVATIDRLSHGRIILVVGCGYLRSEFRALGRPYEERAGLMEESLDVLDSVFGAEAYKHVGREWTATDQVCTPGPVQTSRPPVWIGGSSRRSRERAARRAEGWSPLLTTKALASALGTGSLNGLTDLKRSVDELHASADAAGRDPDTLALQVDGVGDISAALERPTLHRNLIYDLESLGATHLVVRPRPGAPEHEVLESIAAYGQQFIDPDS